MSDTIELAQGITALDDIRTDLITARLGYIESGGRTRKNEAVEAAHEYVDAATPYYEQSEDFGLETQQLLQEHQLRSAPLIEYDEKAIATTRAPLLALGALYCGLGGIFVNNNLVQGSDLVMPGVMLPVLNQGVSLARMVFPGLDVGKPQTAIDNVLERGAIAGADPSQLQTVLEAEDKLVKEWRSIHRAEKMGDWPWIIPTMTVMVGVVHYLNSAPMQMNG